MRRKLMTLVLALSLAFGTAGVAMAGNGKGPDADGPAKKGLCTAYFNGQKKGHQDGGPQPFQNLGESADEAQDRGDGDDEEGPTTAEIFDYCGGLIGGNPDENGRFTTCWTDDDEDSETHPCED